jgi:hypothetical protein
MTFEDDATGEVVQYRTLRDGSILTRRNRSGEWLPIADKDVPQELRGWIEHRLKTEQRLEQSVGKPR